MTVYYQMPLFKLPIFAIESILCSFFLCDLVHFSFISKRCRQLISGLRVRCDGLHIKVNETMTSIHFLKDKTGKNGEWRINFSLYEDRGRNTPITATINEVQFRSFIEEEEYLYSYSEGNLQNCVEAAIEYVEDLFKTSVVTMGLHTDNVPDSRYPVFVKRRKLEKLMFKGINQVKTEKIIELTSLYAGTESTLFYVPVEGNFLIETSHWDRSNHIYVWDDAHWITRDMFLNIKCSRLFLRKVKLSVEDCRTFVRQWYNSNDVTLKTVRLQWDNDLSAELNFENLGFELLQFDPKRRERGHVYYYRKTFDVSHGWDIIRKDGLLATIALCPRMLVFCVWHDRFPNKT